MSIPFLSIVNAVICFKQNDPICTSRDVSVITAMLAVLWGDKIQWNA
jgi:hypothetical protein